MSPLVVIGSAKPAEAAAHAGTPPVTVRICPLVPVGSLVAAPAAPPVIISPRVVIGLAKPEAGVVHEGIPVAKVKTCPFEPTPNLDKVPPLFL